MEWGHCADCTHWYAASAMKAAPVRCQNDRSYWVFYQTKPDDACDAFKARPERVVNMDVAAAVTASQPRPLYTFRKT